MLLSLYQMRKELQKYFSLFLLLLFLFPIAEKQVHALQHLDDIHCTATDKHFHEQEHHCDICDLTLTDVSTPPVAEYRFTIAVQQYLFTIPTESVFHPAAFKDIPSRAPPTA